MKIHAESKPLDRAPEGRDQRRDRQRRAPGRRRAPGAARVRRGNGRPLREPADAGRGHPALLVVVAPLPGLPDSPPIAGPVLVDTGLHPSVTQSHARTWAASSRAVGHPRLAPGGDVPGAAARPRPRSEVDPGGGHDPPAFRSHVGDLGVPGRHVRHRRARVGGSDHGPQTRSARLPPRSLRLHLRLPHAQLRGRADLLVLDLRAHLRPVRRREHPARVHARVTRPATSA